MMERTNYCYTEHLDPFDTAAFNEGYSSLYGQGNHATTQSPALSQAPPPEHQAQRDSSGCNMGLRPRRSSMQNRLMQQLSKMSLCSSSDAQVDTQCIGARTPNDRSVRDGSVRVHTRADYMRGGSGRPSSIVGYDHPNFPMSTWTMPESPGTRNEYGELWRSMQRAQFDPESVPAQTDRGGSSSVPEGFTLEQIAPYRTLEQNYAWLFQTTHIREVADRNGINAEATRDVDMDECVVINTTRGRYDSIGTTGVATCIAICAQGTNRRGENILGLSHYSGIMQAEDALAELKSEMRKKGVRNPEVFLVGGTISKDADTSSLEMESDCLALHDRFNIRGAKLHVSITDNDDEPNYVNVVMTANQIHYGTASLYG